MFHVDKVFVLALHKNKFAVINKFKKIFQQHQQQQEQQEQQSSLEYYFVDGVGGQKNEGEIDKTIWNVMNHQTIDNVAIDIYNNHLTILKKAYEKKYSSILLLEEDCVIENIDAKRSQKISNWLKNNIQWDLCYLGYAQWPFLFSTFTFMNPNIVKVTSPLCAHGIIFSRKGMKKILDFSEKNKIMHVDKLYRLSNTSKFAVFPMIAFQSKEPALFEKALDIININISFRTICRVLEIVSLLVPFVIIFSIYFLFHTKSKKKNIYY
jgi:hypothetical protein